MNPGEEPIALDADEPPQEQVARLLRRRITEGAYAPNQMLPTRRELGEEIGVATSTVQRALNKLWREGFVERRRRVGTWVSLHPPHIWHIGLVFPRRRNAAGHWSRSWDGLLDAAESIEASSPYRFPCFYLSDEEGEAGHDALAEHIEAGRLGGLVAMTAPAAEPVAELLTSSAQRVPSVAIQAEGQVVGLDAVVAVDPQGWLGAALAEAARCGCRAPAVLNHSPPHNHMMKRVTAHARAHGLALRPADVLYVNWYFPDWAYNAVHALLERSAERRPDALLITDDHLLDPATRALEEASPAVQRAMRVVAHTNFNAWEPARVPVTRLGYDSREVLTACLEQLTRLRAGEEVEPLRRIAPRFEPAAEANGAGSRAPDATGMDSGAPRPS